MSYQVFKQVVATICARCGGITPQFSEEDGRYVARCDDIEIVGNSISVRLAALWDDGHQAIIPQEVCDCGI